MEPDALNEDLELIEAHLDGARSPVESESLGRRLAAEPALAEALHRLRAERDVRRAVWASLEPDADHAQSVASVTLAAAARAERWRRAVSLARRATAAAAVVLLAFAGGWAARGRISTGARATEPVVRAVDRHSFASSGGGNGAASFPVALTDERGNIIAVQHFSDARKAREFAEDVDRWQSGPRRAMPAPEPLTPVSDEF